MIGSLFHCQQIVFLFNHKDFIFTKNIFYGTFSFQNMLESSFIRFMSSKDLVIRMYMCICVTMTLKEWIIEQRTKCWLDIDLLCDKNVHVYLCNNDAKRMNYWTANKMLIWYLQFLLVHWKCYLFLYNGEQS